MMVVGMMPERQQPGRVGAEETDRERLFTATLLYYFWSPSCPCVLPSLLTGSLLTSHLAPHFYTPWQG